MPEEAWDALDVQAMVADELGPETSARELAQSVAGVMATCAGVAYDLSNIVIGGRGNQAPFAKRFADQLARVAGIPITDRTRGAQLSHCEDVLSGYLREAMRARGQLVYPDARSQEQVWVRSWQSDGRGQRQQTWVQRPLREHAALLATSAVSMFEDARRPHRDEELPLLERSPGQIH